MPTHRSSFMVSAGGAERSAVSGGGAERSAAAEGVTVVVDTVASKVICPATSMLTYSVR